VRAHTDARVRARGTSVRMSCAAVPKLIGDFLPKAPRSSIGCRA
jgi:hypothetical protein